MMFASDYLMRCHKKKHDIPDMPGAFKCPIEACQSSFGRVHNLRCHISRVHGEREKNYTCRHCPLKFYSPSQRKMHEDCKHLNNLEFKCDLCDFATSRKSYINVHKRSVHEGIVFHCEFPGCNKSYRYRGRVYEHRLQAHGIPRPTQNRPKKVVMNKKALIEAVDLDLEATKVQWKKLPVVLKAFD